MGAADCGEPVCCKVGQSDVNHTLMSYLRVDDWILDASVRVRDENVSLDLDVADALRRVRTVETESGRGTKSDRSGRAEPAGFWGDYRTCDTPLWSFEDALDRIVQTHAVDVVYYIGDTIDHGVWETSVSLIRNMTNYVAQKLHEAFGDVPVYFAIGNHESQPTNQFAPDYITVPGLETHWLYENLAVQFDQSLPTDALTTLRQGGYYTALVRPGLRVVTINSNVAYKHNWWLVHDPQDSKWHLQWLADTLHAAEMAGEKVHLLSHISPGVPDLTRVWTREYNRIVTRFSSTITAEFNGHTHSDEFKVYYGEDGAPVNVAWNAGSVTAYENNNPNYKIVRVDGTSYVPLDMQTYTYNLTEANLTPDQRPAWFMLYDFREQYGVADLSAAQIDNLVTRMVTTDKNLLDTYTDYQHKLSDTELAKDCDDECKLSQLCKTVVTVLWERQKCEQISDLYHSFP